MGNKQNKQSKKQTNKQTVIKESKHSCKKKCFQGINTTNAKSIIQIPSAEGGDIFTSFIFTQNHKISLSTALSYYREGMNINNLISIIESYLKCIVTDHDNDDKIYYKVYCHGEIDQICNNWFKARCPMDPHFKLNKLRITVIGKSRAGKSTLVHRFRTGAFPSKSIGVEDTYRGNILVNTFNAKTNEFKKEKLMLEIMDTAYHYSDRFKYQWYSETEFIILVFAIDENSWGDKCLDTIIKYWDEIRGKNGKSSRNKSEFPGVILVATQIDTIERPKWGHSHDQRTKDKMIRNHEMAMKLSKIWNIPYFQTSAKDDMNVQLLFHRIIYEYWIQSQFNTINWSTKKHQNISD